MSYSQRDWRKAILSVMSKEPTTKQWKKSDLIEEARNWLAANDVPFDNPKIEKEFNEIVESNEISCNMCNVVIGDAEQILNHMENIHPEYYKKVVNSITKYSDKK